MEIKGKIINLFNYKEKNIISYSINILPTRLCRHNESFDDCTIEIERTEIDEVPRIFEIVVPKFSSNTKKKLICLNLYCFGPGNKFERNVTKLPFGALIGY